MIQLFTLPLAALAEGEATKALSGGQMALFVLGVLLSAAIGYFLGSVNTPFSGTGHRFGVHGIPEVRHSILQRIAISLCIEEGHVIGVLGVIIPVGAEGTVCL